MSDTRETIAELHQKTIYALASRIMRAKEFESPEYRVQLPKEGAALEKLPYRDAEEFLVKAEGNVSQIQLYLAQATAARAFFKRYVDMQEKLLLGDPEIQGLTKNKEQREFNMARNPEYARLQQDYRTSETVVAYLEHIAIANGETLQVVKKVRDASLARENFYNPQR